jgi:hypothetical protein
MKKTIHVFLALLLAANPLFPQKAGNKSVFGVNSGVSVPFDDFADKTMNYNAGFASAGPNIEAEYLYYGKIIGFSSSIGYANVFFNEKAYQAEYAKALGGYGTNVATVGNYQMLKFLAGFALKVPEFSHTEVMLLFHLGYALTVHPDLLVTNSELGEINRVPKDASSAPVCNAGLKINYWLDGRYGLSLNAGLNLTRPGFYDSTGPGGSFFLPVHYLNLNVGFVMKLNPASL